MFLARRSLGIAFNTRRLSSRASAVLGALDIPTTPTELPGVYDGEWKGSGDILQSVCPTTGEVLAHVKSVRCYTITFILFVRLFLSADYNRLHQLTCMMRWRGPEKPMSISGAYLRQGEAR